MCPDMGTGGNVGTAPCGGCSVPSCEMRALSSCLAMGSLLRSSRAGSPAQQLHKHNQDMKTRGDQAELICTEQSPEPALGHSSPWEQGQTQHGPAQGGHSRTGPWLNQAPSALWKTRYARTSVSAALLLLQV